MKKTESYCKQIKVDGNLKPAPQWKLKLWEWKMRLEFMIPVSISDRWYKVRCWFNPRNKWATNVIPNQWSDKTYLIPEFLFAAIIDFIDGEKAIEKVVWSKKVEKDLMEIYRWAKVDRKEFQDKIDAAYPSISLNELMTFTPNKKTYEELYGEVNRLEAEFDKLDTKYLTWIVKNRKLLWT
jgi:hypothetical protein